jgi:hypothetical protein
VPLLTSTPLTGAGVGASSSYLYQVDETFYAGGQVFYKKTEFSPNNDAGEDFLLKNGIVDQNNGGFTASVSWDSREKKQSIYLTLNQAF